jgi:hypothetical protein
VRRGSASADPGTSRAAEHSSLSLSSPSPLQIANKHPDITRTFTEDEIYFYTLKNLKIKK